MSGFFIDATSLIVQVAFGIYLFAVLLRFLLQLARADFYNPISQFLVAFTNPPLLPLRRVIPGFFGIDLASVVLLLALKTLELYLLFAIAGYAASPAGLLLSAAVELARLTLQVYFFAIVVRVVLSWFNPYGSHRNPAGNLLVSLTEPLLAPARRLIPPLGGGLDLSPVAVLLLLQLAQLALSHLLRALA